MCLGVSSARWLRPSSPARRTARMNRAGSPITRLVLGRLRRSADLRHRSLLPCLHHITHPAPAVADTRPSWTRGATLGKDSALSDGDRARGLLWNCRERPCQLLQTQIARLIGVWGPRWWRGPIVWVLRGISLLASSTTGSPTPVRRPATLNRKRSRVEVHLGGRQWQMSSGFGSTRATRGWPAPSFNWTV